MTVPQSESSGFFILCPPYALGWGRFPSITIGETRAEMQVVLCAGGHISSRLGQRARLPVAFALPGYAAQRSTPSTTAVASLRPM